MIKSIFFSKFLTKEGPKVIHQVPEGSIVPAADSTLQAPLFNFSSVSEYVIPRQEFCDRLVTVCINRYRILGYPVCITSRKYDRNEFIFNFAIVLEEDADMTSYQSVVRKLAKLFRSLEEQGEFLSRNGADATGKGKVYALCEMILEDLNNYCECMIPIDDSNTLNIKLFPTYPPPPSVRAWHVPLSTVRLQSVMDENWDLTMSKIIPHINGINSISHIASLADTDPHLTRRAISHLLYYGCLLLLDIFQFSAIYAPTASISTLVHDTTMQAECARYVSTSPSMMTAEDESDMDAGAEQRMRIVGLYTSLKQGQTLKNWCIEHKDGLTGVDVRRFITFGVIKGFLYRVHKYPIAGFATTAAAAAVGPGITAGGGVGDGIDPGGAIMAGGRVGAPDATAELGSADLPLARYLDGRHSFDEICTELHLSEKELLGKLKGYGDVWIVHR